MTFENISKESRSLMNKLREDPQVTAIVKEKLRQSREELNGAKKIEGKDAYEVSGALYRILRKVMAAKAGAAQLDG